MGKKPLLGFDEVKFKKATIIKPANTFASTFHFFYCRLQIIFISSKKEAVTCVYLLRINRNLLGVPWDQALQGDQHLRWDLEHQQDQLHHVDQQGPVKEKGRGRAPVNDTPTTRSLKLFPRKWVIDNLPWHQLCHQLQEDHESQDFPVRKYMKQKSIEDDPWAKRGRVYWNMARCKKSRFP